MDLESVLKATAEKLKTDFKLLSSEVKHQGSKGRIREAELVEGFLRPHLPQSVAIAHSAEIVATDGSTSNECDIVLYDRSAMSFIEKTDYKVIPTEAVYVVIEVKSFLSKGELRTSVDSIKKLKSMKKVAYTRPNGTVFDGPLSDASDYHGRITSVYGKVWPYFPTLGYIFAYDSPGLESVRRNLIDLQAGNTPERGVDGVWVLEKGVVIHWSDIRREMLYAGDPDGYFRAGDADNPLLLMLVMLQMWCQNAWMPPFDVLPYLRQSSLLRLRDSRGDDPRRKVPTPFYLPISPGVMVAQSSPASWIGEWRPVERRIQRRDETSSE